MNPIVYGDYPAIMRSIVKNRLPKFTEEESLMLKGSFGFIGLNYYTANYAAHISTPNPNISCSTDNMVYLSCKSLSFFKINSLHIYVVSILFCLFIYLYFCNDFTADIDGVPIGDPVSHNTCFYGK